METDALDTSVSDDQISFLEPQQDALFDVPRAWEEHWVDMPEFVNGDDRAVDSLRVYFRTLDDKREFLRILGIHTDRRKAIWFPLRPIMRHDLRTDDVVHQGRYPIYVISKGRWDTRLTVRELERLGLDHRVVVEPQELEKYAQHIDRERILVLPEGNLGSGSIPARNFVWEHAIEIGSERHWILDDNISHFTRLNHDKRVPVSENPFIPCEDFVDRYENVALAGLQYRQFNPQIRRPYQLNTRIYSCILIANDLPFRWRGRYNEDTDLSLRVLKAGYVTVLFHAYRIDKAGTMTMSGGNTDELYVDDGRLKMAESLREQHPDVVRITEKWGRPQHLVDYSPFRFNELIPKRSDESHNGTLDEWLEQHAHHEDDLVLHRCIDCDGPTTSLEVCPWCHEGAASDPDADIEFG